MIADDEKILRDSIDTKQMELNVSNTIKQLNKIGFNNSNTKFHINSKDISPNEYQLMLKLMSLVTLDQLSNIFGKKNNIGEYFYVFYQLIPCFLSPESQCIVVCGIDQDPFFRLARFLAKKIGYKPPIILYTKNVPGLDSSEKMSTSNPSSCPIFLSDSNEIIKNKIFKIKKVGADTLDELFERGAKLESDTLIQLARLFEHNRFILKLMERGYSVGFYNNNNNDNNQTNSSDQEHLELIKLMISSKGFVTRNNKTMITTFGIREYLTNLIIEICSKYNH
jgi:tryptophanyl-tRNA synthetase